jgi:cytochrome P450
VDKVSIQNIHTSIPGPTARFGRFVETAKVFNDPIQYFDQHFKKYGRIFGVLTSPLTTPPSSNYPGTICIYGPDLIRELCSDHDGFHRSALSHRLYPSGKVNSRTKPLRNIMTGLTHVRGEIHRAHRRLILPAFHKQRVKTYLPVIVSETQKLMDEWRPGEVYDLSREMSKLILRISARSLFGQTDRSEGQRIGLLIDQWVDFIMSVAHLSCFIYGVYLWKIFHFDIKNGCLMSTIIHLTPDFRIFRKSDIIVSFIFGIAEHISSHLTFPEFLITNG